MFQSNPCRAGLARRPRPRAFEREVTRAGSRDPSRNALSSDGAHPANTWARHRFLTVRPARTARKGIRSGPPLHAHLAVCEPRRAPAAADESRGGRGMAAARWPPSARRATGGHLPAGRLLAVELKHRDGLGGGRLSTFL